MAYNENFTIKGLQKAQADNQRRIAMFRPHGEIEQEIKDTTIEAQRFAISITHVWHDRGGALRASHRMKMERGRGIIYIDPKAVNPRGQKPSVYGFYENKRGGDHAFYDRTVEEFKEKAVSKVNKRVKVNL